MQIHGKISEKLLSECKTPVIRAINVSGIESIGDIENLDNVKGILFDSAVPGSGKSFDWSMLERLPKKDFELVRTFIENARNSK